MTTVTAPETTAAQSPWIAPVAAYAAFALVCIVMLHPTALDMIRQWASSSSYTHGFVVAPIALWMILDRRGTAPAPAISLWLLLALTAAAALWLMGRAAGIALIEQLAFVSLLIAGAGAIFGTAVLRYWSFPLVFLFFMVPFGEALIPALQIATAEAATRLLNLFGVAASIDGILIRTQAGVFEIAEACAGLRFLLASVMVAAVFAYLHFQTWRQRLTFLAIAVTIALAANALRAFFLILIATLSDMRWAVGPDHLIFGLVFYALIFIALLWIGRRMSGRETPPQQMASPYTYRRWQAVFIIPAFAIIAAAALYAHNIIDRPISRPAPDSLTLFSTPGWRILPPPKNWRANIAAADHIAAATYTFGEKTVYVASGYYTHDRYGAEIFTYANRTWHGDDWRRIATIKEVAYLFGASQELQFDILAGPERRRLAVITVYWWNDEIFIDPWRMKLAQMKAKLMGRNPPGGIIKIAAAYQRNPSEAVQAIRAFTVDLEPFNEWLARNIGT